MIPSRKIYTYISSKFFLKHYKNSKQFYSQEKKFIWDRASKAPIFFINKSFFIHKGLYFRKKRMEYFHLGIPFGAFAFTRKPFSPKVKVIKVNTQKKKKK